MSDIDPAPEPPCPDPAPGRMPADPLVILRVAALFYCVLFATALAWCRIRTGSWLPATATGGRLVPSLGLGAGTALLVVVATGLLYRQIAALRWFAGEVREMFGPIDARTALGLAVCSSIGEEFFFRGAMQPAIGYVLTSVIFGLVHTGPARRYLAWTVFALVLGFVLGGIQETTGCLWGPVLAHGGINAVNLWRIGRLEAGS